MEEENNPEEEELSVKGSSAPEESADIMGSLNFNPEGPQKLKVF